MIKNIKATKILDSRGRPTLKVTVDVDGGVGSFAVPSGASTGSHEALELGDQDGVGVTRAIGNVIGEIAQALAHKSFASQSELDEALIKLDGTKNKSRLSGNAILGVSAAYARAMATASKIELYEYLRSLSSRGGGKSAPLLYMNLVNGGLHAPPVAGQAHSHLAFQEYHVVPQTVSVAEALEIGKEVLSRLTDVVSARYGKDKLVWGDEGGIALDVSDPEEPLIILAEAVDQAGVRGKVRFALDVAASSFYKNGRYKISDSNILSADEMHDLYAGLIGKYDLLSIEDPFAEEDFDDFAKLLSRHKNLIIVGDDLTVTNPNLISKAIKSESISGVIIKMNQIGTVTETVRAIELAHEHGIKSIVSHRSGETEDTFIADLAHAYNVFGLKSGAPRPRERVLKYERLISITNY